MDKINNLIWQAKHSKNKNWLKAVNLLKEVIREDPDNQVAYEELSDIYLQRKLHKEAIKYLQKVLELDSENNTILFRLGNAYLTLGENIIAIRYYRKITDYFPEAKYNLAIALNRESQTEEAILILEKVLDEAIISEMPYFFLIELYLQVKRFDDAIRCLDIVEKKFGKQGRIYFFRGLAFYNLANWLKAYMEFVDAEKMNFSSTNYFRAYGITCEKIGKFDKAVEIFKELLKKEPYDSFIYVDLINILIKNQKLHDAKLVAELATKFIPNSSAISMLHNKIIDQLDKED